ncbi:unnamed protein product [Owenia fusiformis]|uniref:Uncharacterized protein n=1 Tax=Owenia fusiformis TaxID=6347 RepID=A0A8S4PQP7_OWEFU|nr:unnamed protein product [Owenia fusiformis]
MPVHAPPAHYEIRELEHLIPKESIAERYRRWLIETGKLEPTSTLVPSKYQFSEPYGTTMADDDYIGFIKHEIARENARLEQEARRAEQEAIYTGCYQEVGNYDNNMSMSQLSIGIPSSGAPSPLVNQTTQQNDNCATYLDNDETPQPNFSDF